MGGNIDFVRIARGPSDEGAQSFFAQRVAGALQFSNDRKRMSIIVRREETGGLHGTVPGICVY